MAKTTEQEKKDENKGGFLVFLLFSAAATGVGWILTRKPNAATLFGRITDSVSGAGVPGVRIVLDTKVGQSDGSGNYRIGGIVPGDYQIVFDKPGYESVSHTITLPKGDNRLDVVMSAISGPIFELIVDEPWSFD